MTAARLETSVNWPVGVGGKGNEGVAGLVKQTPGSLGYVELIFARQNNISYGSVQNQAGEFVNSMNTLALAIKKQPRLRADAFEENSFAKMKDMPEFKRLLGQ